MKRAIAISVAACLAAGAVWAKSSPQAAAAKAVRSQQKAAAHAMKAQQKAGAQALSAQRHVGADLMGGRHHGGGGWHGPHAAPSPHVFRRGGPPPDIRGWRRGPAPHPHYRSGWHGNVWYDAYGYPFYGSAVVAPAPVVVQPVPVVAPQPVVVQPQPVVVPARPIVY